MTSSKRDRPNALDQERQTARRRLVTWITAAVVGAVALLGLIFLVSNSSNGSSSQAGDLSASGGQSPQYRFVVGNPGPDARAPGIKLPSTGGGAFDLAAQRGKTVLLYFQEGLTCEPCWTQLKDLDRQLHSLKAQGVQELVTITSDPLDQLQQKVADEGITTPVLSDANLTVSSEYSANKYGMMGASRDGHTFVVVGPTGRIEWRADYGGPPNYTMYVPVPALLSDLQVGLLQFGATRHG